MLQLDVKMQHNGSMCETFQTRMRPATMFVFLARTAVIDQCVVCYGRFLCFSGAEFKFSNSLKNKQSSGRNQSFLCRLLAFKRRTVPQPRICRELWKDLQ